MPGLYQCSHCGKSYSDRSNLRRHLTQNHPSVVPTHLDASMPNSSPFQALLDHWKRLPDWHPQRTTGINILRKLKSIECTITTPIHTNVFDVFTVEPSWFHLFTDIAHTNFSQSGTLISTATCTSVEHLTRAHLDASFRAVDSGVIGSMSPANLCAASSIQVSPDGFGACGSKMPLPLQDYGFPPCNKVEGSTAVTPRGHITDIHQDSLFQGRVLVCLFGRKLFLIWPPTDHNLAIYEEFHGHYGSMALPLALSRLQDLEVILFEHGGIHFLPPGSLHAVFALDSSATFAFDIVFSTMLPEVIRLSRWEIQFCSRLRSIGDPTSTVPGVVEDHDHGVALWHGLRRVFHMGHTRSYISTLRSQWADARPVLVAP